ncbi:MAG: hypothetical protein JW857_11880 [Bacteroidales bacterium]|nr:hypothetical protein [Bacteroidales bacterium]MBN2747183.1 hypothetical protein [Bacteroidales bacterium]
MYKNIDGTITLTVNDWLNAGLTADQFKNDSKRRQLEIFRRGIYGNTLINVKSIKRPDRLMKLEKAYGQLDEKAVKSIFHVEIDTEARDYYIKYRKPDTTPLDPANIEKYTNRASIFNAIKKGLNKQIAARAKSGKRINKGTFWKLATDWYMNQMITYPTTPISNERALKRAFDQYLVDGYYSIIHKNEGNDAARKVSVSIEKLLMALWRNSDKPFINEVHEQYLQFVSGERELFDDKTGEIYRPSDFRQKGRAMEISVATAWNYLKDVVNETITYTDRNGNFDYVNKRRPKQHRKLGQFSLSKISMDDVAMSRKSVRGWVYKYISVDVVSSYWFRPAYVVGKPSHDTVIESFRNMFIELQELGLPMPGELEVEHHLMKDMSWLGDVFPFLRFAKSSTDKRAEHKIKELKYGAAKKAGHTRGRWYAKHEAWRAVRNKVSGDYVDPLYQPQTIVADDLADIEKHNNSLHPLQKTYPGMTRKQVFLSQINPNLKAIEPWYLYKFIGNSTDTTIYNNDYCPVNQETFELVDFDSLSRLKPNNKQVTAYWLPESDGSILKVYLYQGDTYIGECLNRSQFDYNENTIERTDKDTDAMLHQNKRLTKYDKFINSKRHELPHLASISAETSAEIEALNVQIIENPQPKGYEMDEDYETTDWASKARASL